PCGKAPAYGLPVQTADAAKAAGTRTTAGLPFPAGNGADMRPPPRQFAEPLHAGPRRFAQGPASPGPACDPPASADPRPRRETPQPPAGAPGRKQGVIAALAGAAVVLHLVLLLVASPAPVFLGWSLPELPLIAALLAGGVPLVLGLLGKLLRREF